MNTNLFENNDYLLNIKNEKKDCIVKVGNKWRIRGNNVKYWNAEFDTKKAAQSALRAYWANKNEAVFTISDEDYEYEEDVEEIKSRLIKGNKLTLGGYTWTRIGKLQGHDLYLYDDIVRRMAFSSNSMDKIWMNSVIRRWLNNDFYNNLSDDEKEIIIKNRELDDNIFLLSDEEYKRFRKNIHLLSVCWWLRSYGYHPYYAGYVGNSGDVYSTTTSTATGGGVRPALLV